MKSWVLLHVLLWPVLCFGGAVNEGVVPGKPFIRYTLRTPSRPITFYLADQHNGNNRLPLVVWVQGTGCESHFERGEDGKVVAGLIQIVHEATRGTVITMAVEKPGVQYLDPMPRRLEDCPDDFLREYTLDSWTETIVSAIDAARELPGVDPNHVLVIGHSEGGIIAVRVSNLRKSVGYVASLSGGGPTFLAHISDFVRLHGGNPEKDVYACWKRVRAEPQARDKFCWGGTYRQWTSFMRTSIIEEALASQANLYFAHGSADKQNTIAGFDVLRAELAARGRAAVFERIEGADHGLNLPGQEAPEGLRQVFLRVLRWFVAATENSKASKESTLMAE